MARNRVADYLNGNRDDAPEDIQKKMDRIGNMINYVVSYMVAPGNVEMNMKCGRTSSGRYILEVEVIADQKPQIGHCQVVMSEDLPPEFPLPEGL
jgi:hypothetical protein